MYQVIKRVEISAAHSVDLGPDHKCSNLHGHNWIIEVTVESEKLDEHGMVMDFNIIKNLIMELDHTNLNNILPNPTTAECIAYMIAYNVGLKLIANHNTDASVTKVSVQESEGNLACYIP